MNSRQYLISAKPCNLWPRLLMFIILALSVTVSLSAMADAASEKDDLIDARLEGYVVRAALPDASGTTLTWMLFSALATVALGVMFTNSKRTHLD